MKALKGLKSLKKLSLYQDEWSDPEEDSGDEDKGPAWKDIVQSIKGLSLESLELKGLFFDNEVTPKRLRELIKCFPKLNELHCSFTNSCDGNTLEDSKGHPLDLLNTIKKECGKRLTSLTLPKLEIEDEEELDWNGFSNLTQLSIVT